MLRCDALALDALRCVVLQTGGHECFQMRSFCATSTSAKLDSDRTWQDPPGKISNAPCEQSAVAYAQARVLPPPHSHTVLGNGSTGQKDHPTVCGPPVSYHPKGGLSPQRSRRGRGRFVSTVSQDRPAYPPCTLARRSCPDRKMVCAQTHTQPSVLASRTPATSFPLYALLRSCPVIHNVGTHNGWHVTALFCL